MEKLVLQQRDEQLGSPDPEGNTQLGLGVKNTMDSMDWDDLPLPLRFGAHGAGLA